MANILLVDDEQQFRSSLVRRLKMRGYDVADVDNGTDAVKAIRADKNIDVIVLDRKMPGMTGEQTLREIKHFRPEAQVIILTGHGSLDSARETGKLDAFGYLEKPVELEKLVEMIEAGRSEKVNAMRRHEIPQVEKGSVREWLLGSQGFRPGIVIIGIIVFSLSVFTPPPQRMIELLSAKKGGAVSDINMGYADYSDMKSGETIADYYGKKAKLEKIVTDKDGKKIVQKMRPESAAFRAKIMLGVLFLAALFWATGAIPMGFTALMVGVLMYFFGVLKPDGIAQAYAKDAVVFIFGVLAVAVAISKTGLDRRIGLLLLYPAKSFPRLLFIFLPLLAVVCAFISEHALVAFIMPLFIIVYSSSIRAAGIAKDRGLAVMLILSLCFAANVGGPGSPAAGGRNAVMMGILADYGIMPTFGEWVKYGLPFVPVMAFVIGLYFFVVFRKKIKTKNLNVSYLVRQASQKIGPMNRNEYLTAFVLVLLIVLWVTCSDKFGMGGPVILALLLLNLLRVIQWKDVSKIHWEVVALYASACALGKGLAVTGGALYMADTFIGLLPKFLLSGEGLAVAVSLFTGITTNFMSDGATVAAIGPITVPMANIASVHPWMVGFATAFASSFAHMMIIGTPNNAIAYAMAKDPITGEQLVTLGDFFKHGFMVLLLSFAVLWLWTIYGYWQWLGF